MRVALYHPWIYLTSGIERSFVHLLERSRHEWVLYTHRHEPSATFPELRDADIVELQPRVSVRRSLVPLVGAASRIATTRLPLGDARALLVSSEGLGDLVLARTRHVPAVAYCHTPLKIVHDPVNRAVLERSTAMRAALGVLGPAFTTVDRRMWRRYRHVFANSHETRARIASAGLAPADAVEVLHPGVDAARFRGDDEHREGFLLVAGRIMWQKNVELAIDAVRRLHDDGVTVPLVVAGAVDRKSQPYLAELRRRAAGLPVTFEPDPTDERLAALYQRCLALVFTPRNEDFGMVPIEAMAAGAVVVAVDAGGVRETVVDGETGWLVDDDPRAMADRLRDVVVTGVPDALRAAARARADTFGWDHFVDRIDAVMEAAVEDGATATRRG